jgi:hypothetical protein
MKHYRLEEMVKGWFVGAFSPTAHVTDACEVALKKYVAGDKESFHHHKVATEVTLIVTGTVRMMGRTWGEGDIISLSPGEETDFEALTDSLTIVVKTPCLPNDKYLSL